MNKNYTPLDVNKLKSNKNKAVNTVLLIIATITALVLVVLLFVLIQKKSQQPATNLPQSMPATIPTTIIGPTSTPSPVASGSPNLEMSPPVATLSPESASMSAPLGVTPTQAATQSPRLK